MFVLWHMREQVSNPNRGETPYEERDNNQYNDCQTIPRNSFTLFCQPKHDNPSKGEQKITKLKSDCALFSHIYIATRQEKVAFREGKPELSSITVLIWISETGK